MNTNAKTIFSLGALNAAMAVAMGAFGAHVLKASLEPSMMQTFRTGADYHMYHALGLMIIAIGAQWKPHSRLIRVSGWCMLAGVILFSGSLYLLSISGIRWLGAITPLGGLALISGWLILAFSLWKD